MKYDSYFQMRFKVLKNLYNVNLKLITQKIKGRYLKKGRFDNNSEIGALVSKRLYVENKAKLSELKIVNKQYCRGDVLSFQLREFHFVLYR